MLVAQGVIGIAGCAPGGFLFDLIDIGICIDKGEWVEAGISFLAIIPVLGTIPGVSKAVKRFLKAIKLVEKIDDAKDTGNILEGIKTASDVADGASDGGKLVSKISDDMAEKILNGVRKTDGKNVLIGGHSSKILDNPSNAVEVIAKNSDGTTKVKFTTQFDDGNLSKIKTSTLFPDTWSDVDIINAVKEVGDTPSIGFRTRDGANLHRQVINGVQIEVIKIGDVVTSGYPTGGGVTGLLTGFE